MDTVRVTRRTCTSCRGEGVTFSRPMTKAPDFPTSAIPMAQANRVLRDARAETVRTLQRALGVHGVDRVTAPERGEVLRAEEVSRRVSEQRGTRFAECVIHEIPAALLRDWRTSIDVSAGPRSKRPALRELRAFLLALEQASEASSC